MRLLQTMALMTALVASANPDQLCSPYDKDPSNRDGGLPPDGGNPRDDALCCDGKTTNPRCMNKCSPHVGAPVNVLNGMAWLERTDISVSMPWGPSFRFGRHYSTAWAQGRGSTLEVSSTGIGWMHTYQPSLLLGPAQPSSRVTVRLEDTSAEDYFLTGTTYAGESPGRRLTWDATSRLYVASREDGSELVFDAGGKLRVVRAADGGEAQLRYAGDDASCLTSATLPANALCRVDFLFGRALYFRYAAGKLSQVALDAAFQQNVVRLDVSGGQLQRATGADGRWETYTYAYSQPHLAAPGTMVSLLTLASDTDGGLVESFTYRLRAATPARVEAHETPGERCTFQWPEWNASQNPPLARESTVRGSQNIRFTFDNGQVTSTCYLNKDGQCDVTKLQESVPADGWFGQRCERSSDGFFRVLERDALGRVTGDYPGMSSCGAPTPESRARGVEYGYLGDKTQVSLTSRQSVDSSAPAGFRAFTAHDWALTPAPAGADRLAYNQPPLATRPRRSVTVGRTLADTAGGWTTQVQVQTSRFDSQNRLVSVDGAGDARDVRERGRRRARGPKNAVGPNQKFLRPEPPSSFRG